MVTAYILTTLILWILSIAINIMILANKREGESISTTAIALLINIIFTVWAFTILTSQIGIN